MTPGLWGMRGWIAGTLAACVAGFGGLWLAEIATAYPSEPACSNGVCTATVSYDGATTQTYTVPFGVSTLTVTADGAAGGGDSAADQSAPGAGGEISGTLAVVPASGLTVDVGGAGGLNVAGAFGGGAPGSDGAGGGGGSTAIFSQNGTVQLIAGGGGGSGQNGDSSDAGSVPGGDGGAGGQAAAAGSADAGGAGGSTPDDGSAELGGGQGGGGAGSPAAAGGTGLAGTAGQGGGIGTGSRCSGALPEAGGSGAAGTSPETPAQPVSGGAGGADGGGGGGGGGGYAGGGGGGEAALDGSCQDGIEAGGGGGGGGSSYAAPDVSNVSYASGVQAGTGEVVISYADPVSVTTATYTVDEGSDLTVPAAQGLVQQDATGPTTDNDTLTASDVSPPTQGSVTVNGDGSFSYQPPSSYTGATSFGFKVHDDFGNYATGTAVLDVIGPPGAPATPTASASPGSASVSFAAPSNTGNSPITSYTVTASPGGETATGSGSPLTVSGLTPGQAYTFTVTATNAVGPGPASAPSNAVTVPAPPTVNISSPVAGQSYPAGSSLSSSFTCTDGTGGPGIASCVDQNNNPSGTALSTTTPGSYTETVTATSRDGLTSTTSVTYTIVAAPPTTTTTSVTPTAPVAGGPVTVTGEAKTGAVLTCALPSFTASPTFTYQWERNGTPIQGATNSTYTVTSSDEGTTLSCAVTATDSAGSTTVTSAGAAVAVPKVAGCPAATGTVSGYKLGPIRLGFTRTQVRHADPHASTRGTSAQLFLCLTPIGIRVGFASTKELDSLPRIERADYRGRVTYISTSNASYAIRGIRSGATLTAARHVLKLSAVFTIGSNDYYLAPDGAVTAVFKVRHGIIEEIGIAARALTTGTRTHQEIFLTSFG